MKGSLVIIAFFIVGCLVGLTTELDMNLHSISLYTLYILMFAVGLSIGYSKSIKELIKTMHLRTLLIPISTIVGTLLFAGLSSLLLRKWGVWDCLAVGSGFGYYSLSSILITELKEPSIGLAMATELGAIALLANIFREMSSLLLAPAIHKRFGSIPLISMGGVTTMDVMLPMVTKYAGPQWAPISLVHGLLIDLLVPFLVSLFCNL